MPGSGRKSTKGGKKNALKKQETTKSKGGKGKNKTKDGKGKGKGDISEESEDSEPDSEEYDKMEWLNLIKNSI